jgi:GlpG protein
VGLLVREPRSGRAAMRQIGTVENKEDAKRLGDYLLTLGITTRVDERPNGCLVWVHREEKVQQAKREFDEFLKDPSDARYEGVEQTARTLRKKKEEEDRRHIRNSVALRGFWDYRPPESVPVTLALLAASIIVFVLLQSPGAQMGPTINKLRISPIQFNPPKQIQDGENDAPDLTVVAAFGRLWTKSGDLSSIRQGEVWRLVSPILLHFSIWHLLFCLYWLNDIGGMIEIRKGTVWLASLVLLSAILSNLAQYAVSGANFGGMLPVVLSLFGFVLIQRKYLPNANLPLRANTEIAMGLGFLASISGLFFGPTSGVADLVGFGVGVLLGMIPILRRRLAGRR